MAANRPVEAAAPRPGGAGPITVTIASAREALVRELLPRLATERDIRVLGDPIVDPARLLSSLQARRPKLLLLDEPFIGPVVDRTLRALRAQQPAVRVVVLSDRLGRSLVERIVVNRFDGVLLARVPGDACARAIRAVDRGELWLPRAMLERTLRDLLRTPHELLRAPPETRVPPDARQAGPPRAAQAPGDERLTARQAQIVGFVRRGFTNKEIGRQLGIMEDTVKKHLQGVFGKLGVRRRALVALRSARQPDRTGERA